MVDLKEECKTRQISIAGLKLKQQYIDKLTEYESSKSHDTAPAEESVAEKTNGAIEEVEKDDVPAEDAQNEEENGSLEGHEKEDIPPAVESDENLPQNRPTALKVEDIIGLEATSQAEDTPMAESAETAKDAQRDVSPILEPQPTRVEHDSTPIASMDDNKADASEVEATLKDAISGPEPTPIVDKVSDIDEMDQTTNEVSSGPDPTRAVDKLSDLDIPESESRKRKRRSKTPSVDPEEISKKAKAHTGEAIPTKRASRSPSPRSSTGKPHEEIPLLEQRTHQAGRENDTTADSGPSGQHSRARSPSMDEESTVEPALHAATRSLYLKNFKRPLNIQTLRSHIRSVAQGTAAAQDEDLIKFFNVNNIRSHAFVTFSSITAASRVRAAMHQERFPDEPQRDPLWVDFVPDEKVEDWVEQETGGTRAMGRNSATKLEVTYNDTGSGFEAVFQEAYPSRGSRPSIAASTRDPAMAQRQASYSADNTRTAAIASGIHPDRAPLVPRSPKSMRKEQPANTYEPPRRSEDRGHGFRGLDDIFSSTEAKPKLYYKIPSQDVIDDRLDMIKDLYSDRGVSGQPGMKRYTFEKDRGKDEWVDNGPEFGHGKRGQDRLAGIGGGRGRGGFRGRGGRRNYFNGDSYRGGGRR